MSETNARNGRRVVIACRVMEPELKQVLAEGREEVEILYLDQALHRTPTKLLGQLQEKIDQVAQTASRIVLGYGLCSNGLVGVTARQQGLFIPRCHDCIALFLGSPSRYNGVFREKPGTYYLTPGWIAEKKDPLGILEEYVSRYGQETAQWIIEEELKHYTHIALINTGVEETAPLRARAMENAAILNKQYEEIAGSLDYFRELLRGPYTEEKFIHLRLNDHFTQEMFF
ncbi:MAG: DUF1638 domain-containing protein [Proteobacteria bacterium]|nr:DUF1638 domain-containing protein [Pseudomonadota bacterium]MBU2261592.1 DUF1638 domain-containing protein [Pseudomonadota bacterium]